MSATYYNTCNWLVNYIGTRCIKYRCCSCCDACKNETNLRQFLANYYDNCQYYEWKVRMALSIVPKIFISFLSFSSVVMNIVCINWNVIDSKFDESKEQFTFVCIAGAVLFGIEMIYVLLMAVYYLNWYEFNICKPFQGLFDVHVHWLALYWIVIATFVFSTVSYEFK